jgi:hypothetical protein
MPSVEEMAYRESIRAIEMQARSLDEVRARTGILLAGASVVASFLGAQALRSSTFGVFAGLALVAYAAVLATCLAILWPRREWKFALGANVLLEDWSGDTPCGDEHAMQAFVARQIETNWFENRGRIHEMLVLFQWAALGLGAEVVFWTIQVAEGR